MNSRDLDKLLNDWLDDAVFTYPEILLPVESIEAKSSIRNWWLKFHEQCPKSNFTTKAIYVIV